MLQPTLIAVGNLTVAALLLPVAVLSVSDGLLHLLGYDHMDDADRLEMFALQDRLVSEVLGRPAPAPTIED